MANVDLLIRWLQQNPQVPEQVRKQAATLRQETEKQNTALGMSRREWMRTGSEAAFYMRTAAGSIKGVSQELTVATGIVTQLGESFMFGGAVGVAMAAVSVGIGLVVSKIREAEEAAKKAIEPYEKFGQLLSDLDNLADPLAATIQKQMGVTREQALAMSELARNNETYRAQIQTRNAADMQMVAVGQRIAALERELVALNQLQASGEYDVSVSIAETTDKLNAERQALIDLSKAREGDIRALEARTRVLSASDYYARKAREQSAFDQYAIQVSRQRTEALKQLDQVMQNTVRNAVQSALSFTKVTDFDMQAAALYKDKWDEFARRLDAVASGDSATRFGNAFADQFARLGMSAEDAAARFRDFSLFAGGGNLDLVNWEQLDADIERQIDSIIGKSNVMAEAFSRAWERVKDDPARRAALAQMGIGSMDELQQQILNNAPEVDITTAANFQKHLEQIAKDIREGLTSSVTIDINGGGGGGGGGNGGSGGGAAITNPVEMYAEGGRGMVTRSGYIWIDRGEEFWASGTRRQVPPPSNSPLVGTVIVNNEIERHALIYQMAREFQRRNR